MKNEIKAIAAAITMMTAFSVNAGYRVQIPLEIGGGGHLPNESIVFVGGGNEPAPTPTEPEQPTRNLVADVSFFEDVVTYKGFYSASKESKLFTSPNMMIIETILESGRDYYLSNTGFDCVFTANVCTMNISRASGGCLVTDNSLSGQKTELIFKAPAVGSACLNQVFGNASNGFAKSYPDIKIYDGQ